METIRVRVIWKNRKVRRTGWIHGRHECTMLRVPLKRREDILRDYLLILTPLTGRKKILKGFSSK